MELGSPRQFIVLGILLCLSAFFSMAETALTSLGMFRLRHMLDENVRGAELVDKLLSNPKDLLSSILVANNIVNLTAAAMATSVAIRYFGNDGWAVGVATTAVTVLILIFGEITPKTFAALYAEKISLFVAGPVRASIWLLTPVVYLIGLITGAFLRLFGADPDKQSPAVTESALKTMVNVSHEEGFLETDERQMIHNVFEFGDTDARDVMIPRTDIIAVDADESYDEIRAKFEVEHFSRMPIYRDSIDNIIGVLYLKDFAFFKGTDGEFRAEGFKREPFFTYESKPVDELFNLMRAKRVSLAIVLDEYGGTAGLVTLEDLIEEIVGEIEDEYDDVEEDISKIEDNEYLVDGSTKIDDLNAELGASLASEDFESIGGYVIGVLGYIPMQGETVTHGDMTFTIEEVDKNRVAKLRLRVEPAADAAAANTDAANPSQQY